MTLGNFLRFPCMFSLIASVYGQWPVPPPPPLPNQWPVHAQVRPASDDINELVWTSDEESSLLSEEQHKIAFRDVILEGAIRRILNVILFNSRAIYSSLPREVKIPDPLLIPDMTFSKSQPGIFNIDFNASQLKLRGLQSSIIKNLHVIRHLGLKDIRIVAQIVIPLELEGHYTLTGTGLSMLPLHGNGSIAVKIDDFMLTIESFAVLKEKSLFMRRLDLQMTEKSLNVNLENMMGQGLVGDVINDILGVVGEDMLYKNRESLLGMLGPLIEREVGRFLTM